MANPSTSEDTVPQKSTSDLDIAVLIPCYNEAMTVAGVIADFRTQLPRATIYVFDNNSTDQTAEIAANAGAIVMRERRQGKGFVVQSMFQRIDADVYIMVDGDSTYPASEIHRLLVPIERNEADMVVGSRLHTESDSQFRNLNLLGNRVFLLTLNTLFRVHLTDILSGYRVFSREFVKTIALVGGGFEVETELTIKALEAGFRVAEVSIDLTSRPEGSSSKIRPFHDGLRILATIFALLRDYKPLTFFGSLALALVALGMIPGGLVIVEYLSTGLVPRLPSAVLAVGLILMGMMLLTVGLILHSMTRRIRELEYQFRHVTAVKRPHTAITLPHKADQDAESAR